MKKMCVWVVAFGLLVAGCAQETGKNRAVENVAPQERTVQPSKQSELTKGHTVVINIINAPSRGLMVPTAKDGMASVVDANKSPMDSMPYNIPTTQPDGEVKGIAAPGVALAEAKASFLQPVSGITINLGDNTASASQTPSVSTTRGAVSGSLTTSTNGTQEPQVQLVTPITFGMPGASDRKSTRLNSSHIQKSRMPSSA